MSRKKTVKGKIYDSVFTDLISDHQDLLELYQTIVPPKQQIKDISANDIKLINVGGVLTNDFYNDLSFLLKDELIILMEA